MTIQQVFAAWVKYYRHKEKISQEALADKAQLHRTYIGAVERCERNITLLNANKIAQAPNCPLAALLNEETTPDDNNGQ
jgi:transcriptional regulator with XRE-family HTH domain